MASIVEEIMQQLQGAPMDRLSTAIGAEPASTARGVQAALPMLVGALASNAGRQQGAESLLGALDRDHDGSVLDDVAGFLGSGGSESGSGILGHLLGGRRPRAEEQVSRASGLDMQSVGKLLALLAPLVMGVLGRTQRRQGLDPEALAGYLGREKERAAEAMPEGLGGLVGFLDADGDGDVMDDATRLGAGLLGRFLKRR